MLWLPVPLATVVASSAQWGDGYTWFALWGTAGFAMQAMGFWLRVSHELTIQNATDKWLLLSDRRYWELQHKSVDGLSGDGMMSVTQGLIQCWMAAFAVHTMGAAAGHPLYILYAALLCILAVICFGHGMVWMYAKLTLNRFGASAFVQRTQSFFTGCSVFALGLVTGWLLIMAGLFA